MNLKEKKTLVKEFFQMMLNAIEQENSTEVDDSEELKIKRFNFLKKQITRKVKPEEIEGIIHQCYDELFSRDSCYIDLIPSFPENVPYEHQGNYFFTEDTSKLYFARRGDAEEIKIYDPDKFKEELPKFMGEKKEKKLSAEETNKLITANSGHVPHRLINRLEAQYFVSGSRDLLQGMYDKDVNHSKNKALFFTLLSCLPIVTIPFAGIIYNRFRYHFIEQQPLQEKISAEDSIITKLNKKFEGKNKLAIRYFDTTTEEIFKTLHRDQRTDILKNNDIKFKESDIFNSCGELRKNSSRSPFFSYSFYGPSKGVLLLTKEQVNRRSGYEKSESKKRSQENIESVIRQIRNCP